MELTTGEIQRVEHYLDVKDIKFIDIRFEVLDHIISDIESKITKENIDFETAFSHVTDKWNVHLKHSSSYMFGTMFSVPKIVLKKAKKRFSKWFFIPFLIFFATYFLVEKSSYFLSENILDEFNMLFQFLSVSSFIVFVTLFLLKHKLKTSTTYSFILNTQSLNLFMALIILFDYNYINRDGTLDSIQVSILLCYIYSTYTYFHFYKKHKEAIKKYKNL
ncbi:hypothetical protein [Polaribacter sp. Hel1_85]|uniref:hypothetical protein n=1 Tax=Polaribacter sp. Hel1_85 TaxID=1250005 RepID=UPI00052B5AE5|nr:hypothetical protein [Polaribacter sp. Hel1_85]KGL62570.1 conserved hypothetical membrane protein [Polaribacter sp. Hel1_85]